MQPFEKLGVFYLGRLYDAAQRQVRDDQLLYDSRDLTTHAVCVGMTGSGKTGLCLALLEEAAIDGIPAIAIDPKGDLGNLLLTFPELRASDFRPWIDEADAARSGRTPDEQAAAQAELWRKGLGEWGQDGERIARLRSSADFAIYTPGSSAGLQLAVLRSLAAPPAGDAADAAGNDEALRERVMTVASGLLTLLGIEFDPLGSREHVLLSNVVLAAWREGRDLDLPALIREILDPPFERVGVIDLETFYPSSARMAFSMRLNNLLASPGFSAWTAGEPLSIERLLHTTDGRPRISILSIAHLSDAERMFFVTLLLNEVVAWMRTQSGTSSLRALLYMDEIFGYFPPTANPPSKTPMLTLLKQARAYGLGVVLATQNPVDLDYKGLANAGTWFIGRLQTERDRARVLDGLEAVAAGAGSFDRTSLAATLGALESRVFLMRNAHESVPALFHSRWALSYLGGPLTRGQIETLMAARRAAIDPPPARPHGEATGRPLVPPDVPQLFAPASRPLAPGERLVYRPVLLGQARLHYVDAKRGVDHWVDLALTTAVPDGGADSAGATWESAAELAVSPATLTGEPQQGAGWGELSAAATRAASHAQWARELTDWLYRERALRLWQCAEPRVGSAVGEMEGAFRARLVQLARERRDERLGQLRERYAPKLARLAERIRLAEERVSRETSQLRQQGLQTAISVGATLLGAMFGRKAVSAGNVGRATTAARGLSRTAREKEETGRAEDELARRREELARLEREFQAETAGIGEVQGPADLALEELLVRPRKADVTVLRLALLWTPGCVST